MSANKEKLIEMQKVETEGDEQMTTQGNFRNFETNEPL